MTPPPPADDQPDSKPAEADPFDSLLSGAGGGGGDGSLEAAAALSQKISGGMAGGAPDLLAASQLTEGLVGEKNSNGIANALLAEGLAPGTPPPDESTDEGGKAPEAPAQDPAGKDGEETRASKAKAAAAKVNSYIQSRKQSWSDTALVFTGLRSRDPQTARMSALFILSFAGAIYVVATAWNRHTTARNERLTREHAFRSAEAEALAKKLGDEEKLRSSIVTMGRFTLELNPLPGQKLSHGIMNMAEVEIVLLCDSKKTREFVESHYTYARSLMVTALVAMDREELLSHDGKKKWKSILMKVLNHWLKDGEVVDLYFARLIVN